jgi:hypothetical protein
MLLNFLVLERVHVHSIAVPPAVSAQLQRFDQYTIPQFSRPKAQRTLGSSGCRLLGRGGSPWKHVVRLLESGTDAPQRQSSLLHQPRLSPRNVSRGTKAGLKRRRRRERIRDSPDHHRVAIAITNGFSCRSPFLGLVQDTTDLSRQLVIVSTSTVFKRTFLRLILRICCQSREVVVQRFAFRRTPLCHVRCLITGLREICTFDLESTSFRHEGILQTRRACPPCAAFSEMSERLASGN